MSHTTHALPNLFTSEVTGAARSTKRYLLEPVFSQKAAEPPVLSTSTIQ
jgi:hypothetical protein